MVRSLENFPELATFRMPLRAHPLPVCAELDRLSVRLKIRDEIRQVHVVIVLRQKCVTQGAKTPGSLQLK